VSTVDPAKGLAEFLVYETTFGCDVSEADAVVQAEDFVQKAFSAFAAEHEKHVRMLADRIAELRAILAVAEAGRAHALDELKAVVGRPTFASGTLVS
jgi:hypothetical protein